MADQQSVLRWGDFIRIHGVSTNKDKQTKGLIMSKGFTDPNVYYQNYDQFKDVNFYRESLFQILPKSNFDLHDQLQSDETLNSQQYAALAERSIEQVKQLDQTLNIKRNDASSISVTYGAECVFRHVESGQYLSGVLKAADIKEGAFKLQLAPQLSSFLIFKIQSHRTYQQEGNIVYYDDCLKIHHVKSDCFMNFPYADVPIILDKKFEVAIFESGEEGSEYANNRPSVKKPIGTRIDVINENKSKCLWKFIQHCSYEDSTSKEKIKSHDIVYFAHTKNQGLIASSLTGSNYYMKELKQQNNKQISYQCFWELIPKEVNQNGPQKCSFFWARNIVTGQILTFVDFNVEIKSKVEVEGGGFNNQGLVNLICSGDNLLLERGEIIGTDASDESKSQVEIYVENYLGSKIKKIQLKAVQLLAEDSFKIFRVAGDTIFDVAYILSSQEVFLKIVQILSTQLKKKRGGIYKEWKEMFLSLNEDLLSSFISVLKLLTGKIFGVPYDEIYSSGSSPIGQIQKILVETGVAQLLIEVVYILYQPFQFIQRNNEITEDMAIRKKVVQIFELSYVLLEKISKDFFDNKIYLTKWIKLFILHSNNINKTYIQECLVSILLNNPVSIKIIKEETIQDLINEFFKQAKQASDKNSELPTKHLRLFSTFIKGDDIIFKENQKFILNNFFNNNEQNEYNFKFKVEYKIGGGQEEDQMSQERDKQRNKEVKIIYGKKDEPCTIGQFFEFHNSKFNYLMSYISLLADVCMDRNNEAIEYVETNLPLSVVATVLFDPEIEQLNSKVKEENSNLQPKKYLNSNIHEPFIRIGHHAYINNSKFSPIRRIRKIVNWYREDVEGEFNEAEQIAKTNRVYQGEKEEEQKNYIKDLLEYIRRFLEYCKLDINNLHIMYTVLNFLKETIILGDWESIDEFRLIIPLLIKNITKIQNCIFFEGVGKESSRSKISGKELVNQNKEKLKMNRPEIALVVQCKNKATQIFKYINQMEIDIRLRYMHNFFQGLYQSSQNFELYNTPIDQKIEDSILEEFGQQERDIINQRNEKAQKQYYKIVGINLLGNNIKKISEDQDIMLKDNIWYNKISKMIPLEYQQTEDPDKDRDLFKHSSEFSIDNIVLSLFELSGFQNKKLLNSSLNMLRAMFGQRRDLIENYKNLLIVGKGNLYQIYSNLKFMRNKFAMLKNDTIIKYDGNPSKSFAYAIFKPYDHLGRQEDKRSGIIQDLFFLARTLKEGVSLKNIESLMHVEKDEFDKKIVVHFKTERQRNNILFQYLNMAEGIYDPLIEYIRIINETDPEGKNNLPQIHRWLLFSIYQYLTLLCFNNMKAKHIFMKYIPDILPQLSKRVGAASLLYEICINNKILVNDERKVLQIIDGALGACVDLQNQEIVHGIIAAVVNQDLDSNINYQKSRILSSLRGILIFNDQGHKRNQQLLMNKLQDNKYRRLVFNGTFSFMEKRQHFNLNPAQTYAVTHFQLFAGLVQSENLINIGKLQNLHPYQDCLKLLTNTNRWQLRRALRSYINRLYYVHKDKQIFLFEEFIRKQFKIINGELTDLIELHRSKMLSSDLKVKNGIRFAYAQSEIVMFILQILITLHEMFLKPVFVKVLKRQLAKEQKLEDNHKKLHGTLIKLLKNLGCVNKLYENTKTITSFIRQIFKLLKEIMMEFHVRYLQKKSEPQKKGAVSGDNEQQGQQQGGNETPQGHSYNKEHSFFRNLVFMIRKQKELEKFDNLRQQALDRKLLFNISEEKIKQGYIDVIFSVPDEKLRPMNYGKVQQTEEYHYRYHLQTASSNIFKVLAKPQYEENQQNFELDNRFSKIKDLFYDSPCLNKLKQDEFYKLVKIFTNMNEKAAEIYGEDWKLAQQEPKPVFSKEEVLKNCFSLIIENPDQINENEKIFIIKLVRCYITESVESVQTQKMGVDKWSADYYTDETSGCSIDDQSRSQLVRRQHVIEQCGGSQLLTSILKGNLFNSTELLNETLLLGIAYLYNGNTHCQNSILEELKNDSLNEALYSLSGLIRSIGKFLIEVRMIKENQKKRNFSYKIVDSYDHFDLQQNMLVKEFGHKTDKFEVETEMSYEQALCRTFRFLQLFCENNNVDMKKFLMTQTNSDDTAKAASINFITEGCQLLRQFFKIMSDKIVSIPPSLLDFINQITQIPCINCQKSLMRSTFFEDISYMAGFFESKQNTEQRKFSYISSEEGDPIDLLQQIYEKAIGLALGNFEGHEDQIYEQFLNKAQAKFLWIVIRQNIFKMIRPKAKQTYGINRNDVEEQIEKKYLESEENQEEKKVQWKNFKEYIIQYEFMRKVLAKFDERAVSDFIKFENSQSPTYRQEIQNIVSVSAILKKIIDYANVKEKLANINPQNINQQLNAKAKKAFDLRKNLILQAQKDNYPHIQQFMNQFDNLVENIEVASNNGDRITVQNLYFAKHPVFSYLASDTCDNIMLDVGRETRRDKLTSLFDFYEQLKDQIEWNYQLKYFEFRGIKYEITSDKITRIREYARFASTIIVVIMCYMIFIDQDVGEQVSYFTYYKDSQALVLYLATKIQLALTLFFFLLWIIMRHKLARKKYDNDYPPNEEQPVEEDAWPQTMDDGPPPPGFHLKFIYYSNKISNFINKTAAIMLIYLKKVFKIYHIISQIRGISQLIAFLSYFFSPVYNFFKEIYIYTYSLLMYESGVLSILLFVTIAIVGNTVGIQWYTVHLFDYFVIIPELANVFKSITDNIGQLSLLSAFAGCFILVFNVMSLNTYNHVIYDEELPDACQNVKDCVLTLYTSGAIGDTMEELEIGRYIFDIGYVVFMEMLFQSLVGGIMIDSYGGLKEADTNRNQDKKNKCYICAMEKAQMQKRGTTFKKHTTKLHFLWNYLFYRYVLALKDPSDYSGLQYDISTQIGQSYIDWFPDNGPKDENGEIQQLINKLKESVGQIMTDSSNVVEKQIKFTRGCSKAVKNYDEKKAIKAAEEAALIDV